MAKNKMFKAFAKMIGSKTAISEEDYMVVYAIAQKNYLTKADKLLVSLLLDPAVEARFDKEWASWESQPAYQAPASFTTWQIQRENVRKAARTSVLGHFGLQL